MQIASVFVIDSACASNSGIGEKGRPMKSVSRPARITCFPLSASWPAMSISSVPRKLASSIPIDLRAPVERFEDV